MKKISLCALLMIAVLAPFAFAQYGPPPPPDYPPPYGDYPPGYPPPPPNYPPPYGDYPPGYPPPPPPHGHPGYGRHGESSASLPRLYLSLNLPFPVQWEFFDDDANGVERAWTWGWALGLDLTALFTRRIGIHLSADAYFPQVRNSFYKGGSKSWEDAAGFGASLFAGPSIAAIRTSRILFAVSPGIHVAGLFSASRDSTRAGILFGLGASAEVAVNITKSWFVRASLDATYDFAGIEREASNSKFYGINERILNFVPAVGVGYRF